MMVKRKRTITTFALLLLFLEGTDCFTVPQSKVRSVADTNNLKTQTLRQRCDQRSSNRHEEFPIHHQFQNNNKNSMSQLYSTQRIEDESMMPVRQHMSDNLTQQQGITTSEPYSITATTTSTNARIRMYSTKVWYKIKSISKVDKQAVAKLGIAFGLTYNIISNINGSISLSLAWYIASKKVREYNIGVFSASSLSLIDSHFSPTTPLLLGSFTFHYDPNSVDGSITISTRTVEGITGSIWNDVFFYMSATASTYSTGDWCYTKDGTILAVCTNFNEMFTTNSNRFSIRFWITSLGLVYYTRSRRSEYFIGCTNLENKSLILLFRIQTFSISG
jgi:hypothetical protein